MALWNLGPEDSISGNYLKQNEWKAIVLCANDSLCIYLIVNIRYDTNYDKNSPLI